MPAGDRTGPSGTGAQTGRAAGYCAGFETPGFASSVPGRGFGMGFGMRCGGRSRGFGGGRGWRNLCHAPGVAGRPRFWADAGAYRHPAAGQKPDPDLEINALKRRAKALQSELEFITKRMAEIDTETGASR